MHSGQNKLVASRCSVGQHHSLGARRVLTVTDSATTSALITSSQKVFASPQKGLSQEVVE